MYRYVSWNRVAPKVMVAWTKQTGIGSNKGQEFYVGVDGDLSETAKAGFTFEGVRTSYTSLKSWTNMKWNTSENNKKRPALFGTGPQREHSPSRYNV